MKCPGQDSRYWRPGAIFETKCPQCGNTVEFFKDDTTRKCGNCGNRFANPKMDFGCASYCKFAEQCIGALPDELLAKRENLLKDRIAIEMKKYFNRDFKRIGHSVKVARHAEKIGKEEGGNMAVVFAAAYLHDIGAVEAKNRHGSTEAVYQEKEGPEVARSILKNLGAQDDLIDEVCDIIGHHHHPRQDESINFKVVYDADMIANLEERLKNDPIESGTLRKISDDSFLTQKGLELASQLF